MSFDPTQEPTEFDRFMVALGRNYRRYVMTGLTQEEDWQAAIESRDIEWHQDNRESE